ncbi:MAG: hypothetical protein JWM33_48, partial [Caulobacteraceae bacterium]|nr:hypothetical protein [Caulobacteraceae bacterium]
MAKPPPFFSPYHHGFVRVAACTPSISLGEPAANAELTLAMV